VRYQEIEVHAELDGREYYFIVYAPWKLPYWERNIYAISKVRERIPRVSKMMAHPLENTDPNVHWHIPKSEDFGKK